MGRWGSHSSNLNITVETADLVKTITANRENHIKVFEETWERYEAAVEKWLRSQLRALKKGDFRLQHFPHPVPENHSNDYDQVIEMLEMHKDSTIELGWADYKRYISDDWDWSEAWSISNSYYTGS